MKHFSPHPGHRNSVDFDFFGSRALDLSQVEQGISFLKVANIIQRDKNTLSAIVDRGGPVKVSFFGVPNLPRLSAAVVGGGRYKRLLNFILDAREAEAAAAVAQKQERTLSRRPRSSFDII
jgi:hypothetical protein